MQAKRRKTRAGCIGTIISQYFAASISKRLLMDFKVFFAVIISEDWYFLLIHYVIEIDIKNVLEKIHFSVCQI
jgi:hypothetical protein